MGLPGERTRKLSVMADEEDELPTAGPRDWRRSSGGLSVTSPATKVWKRDLASVSSCYSRVRSSAGRTSSPQMPS